MSITFFVTDILTRAFRPFQCKTIYLYCVLGQSNLLSLDIKNTISLTANQHGADGEDLFCICISGHVPKPNTGEAAECEVQRCDVGTSDRWAPQGIVAIVRRLQSLSQLMEPTCNGRKNKNFNPKWKVPVSAHRGYDK